MVDYGLPLLNQDTDDLLKRGLFVKDADKQTIVKYKDLLREVIPEKKRYGNPAAMVKAAVMIQKVFRGYIYRKKYAAQIEAFEQIGEDLKGIASKKLDASKAKKASEDKDKTDAKKKPPTKE